MSERIAILGCGWLGFPLAKRLLKEGHQINGSTTSDNKMQMLSKAGINPFLISLSEDGVSGNISGLLKNTSVIVINVPPKLRGSKKENYVKKMENLSVEISKAGVKKVIFVSSTSVYGDIEGEVSEETIPRPSTESGRQLLLSELIFKNDSSLKSTIIRFGGLIGEDRHPVAMLSGKKNLTNGHHPINLIHLDDCIRIIQAILDNRWWNEVFNGVYPIHPKKEDYYVFLAKDRNLEPPIYVNKNLNKGKIILSNLLIIDKKYSFVHKI